MSFITLVFIVASGLLLLLWYLRRRRVSTRKTTHKKSPPNGSRLPSIPIEWLPAENFSFHPVSDTSDDARPLVLLFAWLFAQERHLDKYRMLYMESGFDVLTIKSNVWDFLLPQSGSQQIAARIVRFMLERRNQYRGYIFHAFSVGAYQMGEIFVLLAKEGNKEAESETRDKLKGIIYDSAMDVNEAPLGLSRAITNNRVLQWAIFTLMNVYMRLCHSIATRHYINSSQAVRANKFRCPALGFLSKDDQVANYASQFEIMRQWRQKGISAVAKCWDQSPHVSHLFKHPDEYRSVLKDFLESTAKIV